MPVKSDTRVTIIVLQSVTDIAKTSCFHSPRKWESFIVGTSLDASLIETFSIGKCMVFKMVGPTTCPLCPWFLKSLTTWLWSARELRKKCGQLTLYALLAGLQGGLVSVGGPHDHCCSKTTLSGIIPEAHMNIQLDAHWLHVDHLPQNV